jgi:predicted RNA-binding Zn ribbon-like protein
MAVHYTPTPEMLAFPFDGDRLALDFVGTVGDRAHVAFERLRTPEDLGRWIVEAGLADRAPVVRPVDLSSAHAVREAIYRTVRAAMAGESSPRSDRDAINAAAARPPLAPELGEDLQIAWSGSSQLSRVLSSIARDAIAVLGGPDIQSVRECAASNCSLLFIDESHAQRRRWCSMARCGNRNKTAAYRRRQAHAGS